MLISCWYRGHLYKWCFTNLLFSHVPPNSYFLTPVYVVDKIVDQLPHTTLDFSWSETCSDLKLADPIPIQFVQLTFCNCIDIRLTVQLTVRMSELAF